MSIFGCCQPFPVDESEGSPAESMSKIRKTKNNSLISLNSPKASLRSLTSLKNFKNNENLIKSKEIPLASTADIATELFPHEIQKGFESNYVRRTSIQQSPSVLFIQAKQVEIMKTSKPRVTNGSQNEKYFIKNEEKMLSAEKQNVIIYHENCSTNNKIEQIRENLSTTESEANEPKEKNIENKFIENEIIKILPKKPFGRMKVPSSKMKLGGSKFTILSEGELEELLNDKELKLEESAIILNVFKATESQLGKWEDNANKI